MAGQPNASPITAVCIEVASPDLLTRWLEQGWMPQLRAIRDTGAFLPLRSVADVSSGSIWPSFITGTMPQRHGQFFTHMQLEPGSYRIGKQYANDVLVPPFWDQLNDAGLESALVDVPQTYPKPGFRGAHIVGWGGEYPGWPSSSSPPELMAEVRRRFGTHPLMDDWRVAAAPRGEAQYQALCRDLRLGAAAKADLSRWLFRSRPFDFFLTVFAETHWAMHPLWHLLDAAHPQHDPGLAARHGGIMRDILSIIDTLIGELRAARPDATMLVFALSGMGPNHSGSHLLPEILDRLGLGPISGSRHNDHAPPVGWGSKFVAGIRGFVPIALISKVKRLVPRPLWDRATRRLLYAGAGWSDSRAFCLPNDFSGAIRINLIGREPAGTVAPGAAHLELLELIEHALRELTVASTGEPVVREVVRLDAAAGAPTGLPDLLVQWSGEFPVETVCSPRLGEIHRTSPEQRTGGHCNQGLLIAAGPQIAARGVVTSGHIIDLGPTIATLAGLSPSTDFDGRVLNQLFQA